MPFTPIKTAAINKIIWGIGKKMLNTRSATITISIMLPISKRKITAFKNKAAEIKISISIGISRLKAVANNKAVASKSPMPKIFTINYC